ncbi:MAG: hypothetical protein PHQ12_04305 [Chthoniobacteraceae bacterium]|nr:hypothetical protein [Chthoniobacteraceae bacterium]
MNRIRYFTLIISIVLYLSQKAAFAEENAQPIAAASATPSTSDSSKNVSEKDMEAAREEAKRKVEALGQKDKSFKEELKKVQRSGLDKNEINSNIFLYNSRGTISISELLNTKQSEGELGYALQKVVFKGTDSELKTIIGLINNTDTSSRIKIKALSALRRLRTTALQDSLIAFLVPLVDQSTYNNAGVSLTEDEMIIRSVASDTLARIDNPKVYQFYLTKFIKSTDNGERISVLRLLKYTNPKFLTDLEKDPRVISAGLKPLFTGRYE